MNTYQKIKTSKSSLILTFFISLLSLLFSSILKKAVAQTTNISYTISPPILHFTLNPGEKTEKIFKITNHTQNTLYFAINTVDFVVTDKSGTPELLPSGTLTDNRFSASSWSTTIPDTISVPPGETATTTLYVQVPGNARPGGRYFAVAFKPINSDILDQSGAAISPITGSLVYLTIAGDIKEEARIIQFSAPTFSEYGPIKIVTEIQNKGDAHITPKAQIEIKNIFGKTVFTTALANYNIFPGTSRIYENNWEQKLLFGQYTAHLSGFYGQKDHLKLAAITTFWVIPYKLVIITLLAIAIILILIFGLKNKSQLPTQSEKIEPQKPKFPKEKV